MNIIEKYEILRTLGELNIKNPVNLGIIINTTLLSIYSATKNKIIRKSNLIILNDSFKQLLYILNNMSLFDYKSENYKNIEINKTFDKKSINLKNRFYRCIYQLLMKDDFHYDTCDNYVTIIKNKLINI
jgi:hypothetical protein